MKKLLLIIAIIIISSSVAWGQGMIIVAKKKGDVTLPTLTSATIPAAGNSISLLFDETVSIGAGGNGGWTIDMNLGAGETLTYASGSGSDTLVYTIGVRKIKTGETGTVGYTQPTNGVEDASGNDLANIGSAAVTNNSTVDVTLDDTYNESNGNDDAWICLGSSYQSFTSGGGTLDNAQVYLKRVGTVSGDITANVYSHSGTYGTSSVPNALLATSTGIDSTTIGTSYELITFAFTGANRVNLTATEKYVLVMTFSGGNCSTTYLAWNQDSTSPSHGGNAGYEDAGWTAEVGNDQAGWYIYVVR